MVLLAKNLLKTAIEDMDLCSQHMEAVVRGWIMGQQAQPLFGVPWNTLWEKPLEEIRTELNIRLYLGSEIEAAIQWKGEEIPAKYELVGAK